MLISSNLRASQQRKLTSFVLLGSYPKAGRYLPPVNSAENSDFLKKKYRILEKRMNFPVKVKGNFVVRANIIHQNATSVITSRIILVALSIKTISVPTLTLT